MFLLARRLFTKYWPVLALLCVTGAYFIYGQRNNPFFVYDDFTAFTFVVPRTYWRVIVDSLISKDIDRHKVVGYLLIKLLYDTVGLKVDVYFFVLFILHTINVWLVYGLLRRITHNKWVSVFLAGVFAYRFYLLWIANIENYLGGLFYFSSLHWWLSFVETTKYKYYIFMWLAVPLMVYSYGPTIFLFPALVPLTAYFYGWKRLGQMVKYLLPFGVVLVAYVLIYTHAPDSLIRFASPNTPYYRPVTLPTFVLTQSIYLHQLSRWIPQSGLLVVAVGMAIFIASRRYGWLLLAYLTAILPNSFFPLHTMYYYLYFPIIFVLMYFAQKLNSKRWLPALIVFWLVFNPTVGLGNVVFRLRHPAINFEQQAMTKIAGLTDQAIARHQLQLQLSNWDVTPNLHHAITYGAFPLWLKSPNKSDFKYSYDRTTEILTLISKYEL